MINMREDIYNQIFDYRKPRAKKESKKTYIIDALNLFLERTESKLKNCLVNVNNSKFKNLYKILLDKLPYFAYFKADKTNMDNAPEIQIPLNFAVNEAISNIQTRLNEIKSEILSKASNFTEKLHDTGFSSDILKELKVDFKNDPDWNSIFKLTYKDKENIPINMRGSGSRRILLLSSFIIEIQKKNRDKPIIFAIEEPENSQHPKNQELILNEFQSIINQNHNIILTTHSPLFAKLLNLESLRLVAENTKIEYDDTIFDKIAENLGVLPDFYLNVKVVVCVEGPNDIEFLKNINKIEEYKQIIDIENDNRILLLYTGGSTLKYWINSNLLKKLQVPEIHIYDSDTNQPIANNQHKYRTQIEEVIARGGLNYGFETEKAEIENYVHPALIQDFFNIPVLYDTETDDWVDRWSNDNPARIVKEKTSQLYNEHRGVKRVNESNAKKKICKDVASRITKELLEEISGFEEIKSWFEKIKLAIG